MAFNVLIAPEVLAYLDSREYLTASDRERITTAIFDELGTGADVFLAKNPHPYLPDRYEYDYGLMTEAREYRAFVFACSAEGHVYGVTEVLYADEVPDDEPGA